MLNEIIEQVYQSMPKGSTLDNVYLNFITSDGSQWAGSVLREELDKEMGEDGENEKVALYFRLKAELEKAENRDKNWWPVVTVINVRVKNRKGRLESTLDPVIVKHAEDLVDGTTWFQD